MNLSAQLRLGWIFVVIGTAGAVGCVGSAAAASNTAGSVGTTGTSGGGGSSTGCAFTGRPDGPFVGAVEVEILTTIDPDSGAEPPILSLNGQFLPAGEWPTCASDSLVPQDNPCCFAAGTATVAGVSAGSLVFRVEVIEDGGGTVEGLFLGEFDPSTGTYHEQSPADAGEWVITQVTAETSVALPAFSVPVDGFPPPEPVVTPSLGQLGSLSTSQDWTIPLTPSELEFQFHDRVILEVDGVGSIICGVTDEGAFNPPLVVPAAQLANFTGHNGTVSIYRDEYSGFVDAGGLLIGFRNGVAVRTATGAVSFTP